MDEVLILSMFILVIKGIFGVPAGFVLTFFVKLFLLFAVSIVISKILHLDKAYNHSDNVQFKKDSSGKEV